MMASKDILGITGAILILIIGLLFIVASLIKIFKYHKSKIKTYNHHDMYISLFWGIVLVVLMGYLLLSKTNILH